MPLAPAVLPLASKIKAALPAINGADSDVPDARAKEPSGTGIVERILPPGAATAGLKKKSSVGP